MSTLRKPSCCLFPHNASSPDEKPYGQWSLQPELYYLSEMLVVYSTFQFPRLRCFAACREHSGIFHVVEAVKFNRKCLQ